MFRLIHYSIVPKPYVGIHKMKPAKSTIYGINRSSVQNKNTFHPLNASTLGRALPILIGLVTSNVGYKPDGSYRSVLNGQVLGCNEYF